MFLRDVAGQQAAKDGLLKMWHNDVFPHALLIAGAEGTGGLPLGLALAQYIFCERKTENESCGECPNCSKVSKLEHADLHMSFPTIAPKPNSTAMSRHYIREFREFIKQSPYGTTFDWLQFIEAENKQGNITADECREIIDVLNLKSYEGGKKVQIIWRPEFLKREGNILLKLIEEPPKDTIIIFIAEDIDDILMTIRSRTQAIRLGPVAATDIAERLIEKGLTDATRAAQIAHIAQGNYTEALKLVQHTDNDLFPAVRELFNALFTNNGPLLVKFAEEWSKSGREQQKNLLHYIIQLLEHGIRNRYLPSAPISLPQAEAEFVQKLAGTKVTTEEFSAMVDSITDTIYFISRNAHSKTQLMALAIKLHYILQKREIPIE